MKIQDMMYILWKKATNSVLGVKGQSESTYRTGNVNLTPANILFLGENIPGEANDTRAFWQEKGTGYAYCSQLNMVRGQVSQWGWILNLVLGNEVQQVWLSQSQQHVLKRVANSSVTLMPDYWYPVGENLSATQTLTLGNGTYSKTFYFNRTGNTIFLDSWMDIGNLAAGSTTIGTLNANLRPKYEVRIRPGNSPAPYNTFFTVQTNGTVSIYTSTAITGPANYALHTSYLASNT